MSAASTNWQVILPVKRLSQAKSRLATPDQVRAELVLAMARDTLAAIQSCEGVGRTWLLTTDPKVVDAVATPECGLLDESHGASSDTLNTAIATAVSQLRETDRSAQVAIVVADLPALRPDDLATALNEAAKHRRSFVQDADNIGTTAVMLLPNSPAMPRFGPLSSDRHVAADLVSIEAGPGLRQDVDTLAALEAAVQIGVGPCTSAVIDRRLR